MDDTNQEMDLTSSPAISSHRIKFLRLGLVAFIFLGVGLFSGYMLRESSSVNIEKIQSKPFNTPTVSKKSMSPILRAENNPSITNKWQIYKNIKVGFTFKFPDSSTKIFIPGNPGTYLTEITDENTGVTNRFGISFFPFNGSLEELIQKRKIMNISDGGMGFADEPVNEISTIEFNGIKGKWYTLGHGNYLNSGSEVYFLAKNHAFILRVASFSQEDETILNTYEMEQLLSTFKIVN